MGRETHARNRTQNEAESIPQAYGARLAPGRVATSESSLVARWNGVPAVEFPDLFSRPAPREHSIYKLPTFGTKLASVFRAECQVTQRLNYALDTGGATRRTPLPATKNADPQTTFRRDHTKTAGPRAEGRLRERVAEGREAQQHGRR